MHEDDGLLDQTLDGNSIDVFPSGVAVVHEEIAKPGKTSYQLPQASIGGHQVRPSQEAGAGVDGSDPVRSQG